MCMETGPSKPFDSPQMLALICHKTVLDGDVLHARIWVDPANAGMPNVQLMFEDKTDGSSELMTVLLTFLFV